MSDTTAPEVRFWRKVNKTATCWNWTGATAGKDREYGYFYNPSGTRTTHRFAYELLVGPIPAGVRHHGVLHYGGSFATAEEAGEAAALLRLTLFTHNDLDRSSTPA